MYIFLDFQTCVFIVIAHIRRRNSEFTKFRERLSIWFQCVF